MNLTTRQFNLLINTSVKRLFGRILFAATITFAAAVPFAAQEAASAEQAPNFNIGERLTYDVSFEKYKNAAYFETHVVSRGRLGDKDAVELKARIKTLGVFSSAFYLVDETRTTFISPASGLPLYTTRRQSTTGMPRESVSNFLNAPTPNLDLIALIYRLRWIGDVGAFSFQEGDKVYNVTVQRVDVERVKTDLEEYDTFILNVQSEYLTELGFKDLSVAITSDESRIPVRFRFKAGKSEFRVILTSNQTVLPVVTVEPTPTPTPTPRIKPTPAPTPEDPVYIENQPISADLPFALGEKLEYRLSAGGTPRGTFVLSVKKRSLFKQADSLLLSADFSSANNGPIFATGDFVTAQVNPETLAPQQIQMRFTGELAGFSQVAEFQPRSTVITFGGSNSVDAPVGTHSILSLLYAMRSFNLRPSRDSNNPVNDTRVAVFWGSQPYIFTLRPSEPAVIELEGRKVNAQQITVLTGNQQLNQLNIKVWLSVDARRLPLRISVGGYVADLVNSVVEQPK